MKIRVECAPEGSPNFCFAFYDVETEQEIEFIQSDWEYPSWASKFGWIPCDCGETDGTVKCPHKGVDEMLSSAYNYLAELDGQVLEIGEYQ